MPGSEGAGEDPLDGALPFAQCRRLALAAQQHRPVAGRGAELLQHLDGQVLGGAGLQQLAQGHLQCVLAFGGAVGRAQLHQQHCRAPFL
ncbi:hypothetical protein SDC9_198672 [bioreactor metagenome]|uniref:Uncharacterized protein n=1 Tax=bioreactor metagenome TaxID=1076179 RepID=A0A645IIB7_9ZZZZ